MEDWIKILWVENEYSWKIKYSIKINISSCASYSSPTIKICTKRERKNQKKNLEIFLI